MTTKRADSYETPMIHDTSSFNENDLIEFDNQYEHFEEVNALGGFWKVQEMVNQRYSIRVSYTVVTPESAEQADVADRGMDEESDDLDLSQVTEDIRNGGFIREGETDWLDSPPEHDYRTGEDKSYSMQILTASGEEVEDLDFFVQAAAMPSGVISDIVEAFTGVGQDAPRAVERREFADPNQQKLQFDKGGRVVKGMTDDVVARIAQKTAAEETGY